MSAKCKTVAIANHKGGVGKTTTAVTLAAAATHFRYRALLVDLDPQSQCSTSLGVPRSDGLYHVLRRDQSLASAVQTARPRLDLLPGDRASTARLQDELVGDPWGHLALAEALDRVNTYDVVILDCPPTLGRLNVAALMAADHVIVPTTCNFLGLESVGQYLTELDLARQRRGGPTCSCIAILPTFYDTRTTASRDAHDVLLSDFGNLVAQPIPRATVAERLVENGRTIWELAPRAPVGLAYAWLAQWFYQEVL
jgi:chromosome partitioning protein